ncbi:glycosyltransferase family 87 protein [Gordonia sputi]|uniref:glycosyltransferase family 87 protein n=1 Tax=Gordonia sputi TaxID=36823 RepID=UPI002270B090|nr:glycosyltransferase family 87 protein [Gordonia sputi]
MPLSPRFANRWELPTLGASLAVAIALAFALARKTLADRIRADEAVECGAHLCHLSLVDFRDATWRPVTWFITGNNPYDTETYLQHFPNSLDYPTYAPGHLVLWAPLGWMDWRAAGLLETVVAMAVIVATGCWLGLRAAELTPAALIPAGREGAIKRAVAATWGAILLLLCRPVTLAYYLGQPSIVYVLLAVPAIMVRNKYIGVILVAVCCMKPHIGLAVVVVLLARGAWRRALIGVGFATLVSLAATPVMAGGISGVPGWFSSLVGNISESSTRRTTDWLDERIDIVGSLQHAGFGVSTLTTVAVAVAGVVAAYVVVRRTPFRFEWIAVLLGLSLITLTLYHLSYDAAWLIPPIVLGAFEVARDSRVRRRLAPGLVLLFIGAGISHYYAVDQLGQAFGVENFSIWLMRVLLVAGTVLVIAGLWAVLRTGRGAVIPVDAAGAGVQTTHGHPTSTAGIDTPGADIAST